MTIPVMNCLPPRMCDQITNTVPLTCHVVQLAGGDQTVQQKTSQQRTTTATTVLGKAMMLQQHIATMPRQAANCIHEQLQLCSQAMAAASVLHLLLAQTAARPVVLAATIKQQPGFSAAAIPLCTLVYASQRMP
jgi:hypothetical protein